MLRLRSRNDAGLQSFKLLTTRSAGTNGRFSLEVGSQIVSDLETVREECTENRVKGTLLAVNLITKGGKCILSL